jgi:hypothetical protein
MTKKVSKIEMALIAAWMVLFLGAKDVEANLLFNWSIQAHLGVIGCLLVGSMILRRKQTVKI